jgi:hypothetical protein
MSRRGPFLVLASVVSGLLVAPPAWALCANCLGQSSRLGAALRLVGLFLLVPPAVFFAVAIAVRKLAGQGAASEPASGAASGRGGGVQGG